MERLRRQEELACEEAQQCGISAGISGTWALFEVAVSDPAEGHCIFKIEDDWIVIRDRTKPRAHAEILRVALALRIDGSCSAVDPGGNALSDEEIVERALAPLFFLGRSPRRL